MRSPATIMRGGFVRELHQFIVINAAGIFVNAIGHEIIQYSGEIDRGAVGQVPAVRQIHAQHRISRLQQRRIGRLIGLCPRMWLDIGVLGAEQLAGALASNVFHNIDILAPAVIAFSGIAFRVLVGKNSSHRRQYRGNDILEAINSVAPLPVQLIFHGKSPSGSACFTNPMVSAFWNAYIHLL